MDIIYQPFVGPLLMGLTGLITKRMLLPPTPTPGQIHATGLLATRVSIISVLLLFIVGAWLFHRVDEGQAKKELVESTSI